MILISGCIEKPLIEIPKEEYCEQNNDCMKVKGDCCGCTAGGTATTINKNYYTQYVEDLKKRCGGIGCAEIMSWDITCFTKPVCLSNRCEFDYKDYTICKEAYYKDWCYWQFAIANDDVSLCEKIGHDGFDIKPSISTCKKEIQK